MAVRGFQRKCFYCHLYTSFTLPLLEENGAPGFLVLLTVLPLASVGNICNHQLRPEVC